MGYKIDYFLIHSTFAEHNYTRLLKDISNFQLVWHITLWFVVDKCYNNWSFTESLFSAADHHTSLWSGMAAAAGATSYCLGHTKLRQPQSIVTEGHNNKLSRPKTRNSFFLNSKVLWLLATTNCSRLQIQISCYVTYQMLWNLSIMKCGSLWSKIGYLWMINYYGPQ